MDVAAGTVPFAPVIEALRGLVRDTPPAELDRLLESSRNDIAGLLPQLRRREVSTADTGLAYGSAQGRLFEALLGLLERLAATGPVVLVVEDIHWADRSTLDLLAFLVRNLQRAAILIVMTVRSDELPRRHAATPFLAELHRNPRFVRIDLPRFGLRETEDQLRAISGRAPAPELVGRIHDRSEGNPFFAEELLASDGSNNGQLPDTLRQVLSARVGALSEAGQDILRIAAAAGTRVRPNLLIDAAGTDEATVSAALREAVDHQILTADDDGRSGQFRFRHTLVRDAVYEHVLPGERRRLHTQFADVLQDGPDGDADALICAEIAYHRFAAGDLRRALEASVRAGVAAERALAFAEAHVQFERALELWNQVADAGQLVAMDRIEVLARAADAASKGRPDRAIELLVEAIGLVDPAREPERAGLLQSQLSQLRWLEGDGHAAQEAGRAAVRLVPASPPSVARARVTAALAQILMVEGFMADSQPIAEEAVAIARAVGDREIEGHALNTLGTDVAYLGDMSGGLALLAESRAIGLDVGSVYDVGRAWANIVDLHNIWGHYPDTPRLAEEAFEYDESHGVGRLLGAHGICEGALALYRLGRWADADAMLDRLNRYRLSGSAELFTHQRRAALAIGRGEFDAARARLDAAAGLLTSAVDPQWNAPAIELTAELSLWEDRPGDAARAVSEGIARLETVSVIVPGQVSRLGPVFSLGLRAEADLAGLARVRHDLRAAAEHVARGMGYLARMRSMHSEIRERVQPLLPLAEAYLALCEAEASRLQGASDASRWAAASDMFRGLGMRVALGYSLWRQADAILGVSRARSAVVPLLREGHALASEMGAAALRARLVALASRGRIELSPAAAASPASDHFGLTSREREVLDLMSAGRTNRQIADALFITEKTASAHVSNILTKLNANGRTEAAAIARRVGLLTPTRG